MTPSSNHTSESSAANTTSDRFYQEVIAGLSKQQKELSSKYFYDEEGDRLFQQIMSCEDYYLTRAELEIFTSQTNFIASAMNAHDRPLDIIELGAGDGSKTVYLLEYLSKQAVDFRYLPIDISGNILGELEQTLIRRLPSLTMKSFQGEYLEMLQKAVSDAARRKMILFLGSNIGNLKPSEAIDFCRQIRAELEPGDMTLIGFDLKKNPRIIRAAYDDAQGFTRLFNLNLLTRINKELGADFNVDHFEHYCNYDPETGACKSYLVSLVKQEVSFPGMKFNFGAGECIWMEISQKYSKEGITALAAASGFEPVADFTDHNGWFLDVIWKAV